MRHGLSEETARVTHLLQLVPAHPPPCQSPEQKSQIFNLGGPPCQGNPGCNKDQILPAEPEESHVDENQLCLWQWDESCRPRCSSSRSTCGSRSLKPSSSTWEKTNPHLRSWQPATKSIASHLCSVGRKCICKFGSSCWCSAVNRFCCTKALLFGLKLAKFSCIQHSSSHFREDFV